MINSNLTAILARLKARIDDVRPDSPKLNLALTRIGVRLQAATRINVRRAKLIDTGRLINSIQYEFFKEGSIPGIRVGSFGVPYARIHEFGFNGSVSIREHKRLMTKVYGKIVEPKLVTVKQHSRHMNITGHQYLGKAVESNRDFIIDTIREAFRGG